VGPGRGTMGDTPSAPARAAVRVALELSLPIRRRPPEVSR